MCICLPNGKFNFKFARSHSGVGKKSSKGKRTLSLISESSEEDDGKERLSSSLRSCLKKNNTDQISGDCDNNQWHIRQLSRDRQLPPVPDAGAFGALQINSPSKGAKCMSCDKIDHTQTRQQIDEYGSIYESETYADPRGVTHSPCNMHPGQPPHSNGRGPPPLDYLYAQVCPADKHAGHNPAAKPPSAKDVLAGRSDHDYLYSTIVKTDFNSLRKPCRTRSSVRDYPYQSLQSLNNNAPGVPLRLYRLSELSDVIPYKDVTDSDVKTTKATPKTSKSNSLRRYSQPNTASGDNAPTNEYFDDQLGQDVLSRLQSQYNTPPTKRASLADMRQLAANTDDHSIDLSGSFGDHGDTTISPVAPQLNEESDFYRHLTVRESLASLRARNAIPDHSLNVETTIRPRVYEGLYETLYYSSAEPVRTGAENNLPITQTNPETIDPLIYLSQDNYISIPDNVVSHMGYDASTSFNPHNRHSDPTGNSSSRPSQDPSSGIYATTGSEVYAEISDAYLSRQYEELPDSSQGCRDNGQTNNGYVGSPGTLRVLLEIQSFRHMDSDVDLSSRCTTPLPRSIHAQSRVGDPTRTAHYPTLVRHPWFIPQQSADSPVIGGARSTPTSTSTPLSNKPKTLQTHLAIMTPLMERSMEGSSMFLEDSRNKEPLNDNNSWNRAPGDSSSKTVFHDDSSSIEEENEFCGRRHRRIVYPSFSEPR